MKIEYRISLWNYTHYTCTGSLEEAVKEIIAAGYGVEIWPIWKSEGNLINNPENWERLKLLFKDTKPSLHSAEIMTFDEHRRQIDAVAYIGGDVIVVHQDHLKLVRTPTDYGLAKDMVLYAKDKGVTIALENQGVEGNLKVLEEALSKIEDLKICLDTGHIFYTRQNMQIYVDVLRKHIIHLHLQDPSPQRDHLIPGSGEIKKEEWQYLFQILKEENFHGAGVFEIKPRGPLLSVQDGKRFLSGLRAK